MNKEMNRQKGCLRLFILSCPYFRGPLFIRIHNRIQILFLFSFRSIFIPTKLPKLSGHSILVLLLILIPAFEVVLSLLGHSYSSFSLRRFCEMLFQVISLIENDALKLNEELLEFPSEFLEFNVFFF